MALACSLTGFAVTLMPVSADEAPAAAAVKALEGTWVTSETDSLDAKWIFKGDSLETSVNGMEYKGKIKADKDAKPYATLDIELTDGPDDAKGKTAKAVYKLEGDKLVIAVAVPGGDRPKDFEPAPDEVYLFELKKKS
jgi:uncharacterized protein (TIGR03067 family)